MKTIETSVTVKVPVNRAYNQWKQFEEFQVFTEGVEELRQLDNMRLQWRAKMTEEPEGLDAESVVQIPDQRIAWRRPRGIAAQGSVRFNTLGNGKTKVDVQIEYEPEAIDATHGDSYGALSSIVVGALRRFKEFVEKRPTSEGRGAAIDGLEIRPSANRMPETKTSRELETPRLIDSQS